MPEEAAVKEAEPDAPAVALREARVRFGSVLGERFRRMTELGLKVLLSVVIAFALYEIMIAIFVFFAFGSPTKYDELIRGTNQRLQEYGINAELCLEAPAASVVGCNGRFKDHSIFEPWLSFGVTDNEGETTRVEFAVNNRYFVSGPMIIHSTHSFARIVERAHQAKSNGDIPENSTSNLKLCSGTRKVLDDSICTKIARALKPLSDEVSDDLNAVRVLALFFGIIQFAVFAVFWYIVIECWLTWRRLISAPIVFFKSGPDGAIELVDDLGPALDRYNALENRSPGDRLMARLIQASTRAPNGRPNLSSSVLEDFRAFQVSETEGALGTLDIANEAMLKLAFVGTIWGIGSALFLVRELDSLDSVQRIVSKSEMFAGIGVGFGTTLVGVLLSIVASLQIQSVGRRWEDYVNGYYRIILNDSKSVIEEYISRLPPGSKPVVRHRPVVARRTLGFFDTIGILALLTAGLTIAYLNSDFLNLAIDQLWSLVSGG